jgi:hypothetical protein
MMKRCMRYALLTACGLVLTLGQSFAQEEAAQPTPLDEIATRMAVVVRDLSRQSTGKPTQVKQQTVKTKLDTLIAELEKECANCRGPSGANPTKPLNDSVVKGGPGGIGDLRAPRNGGKKWGDLPAHERDRILQSMTEGFPPQYQRVLERYYRQLAEEKPTGEAVEKSENGTEPAKDAPAPVEKDSPKTEPVVPAEPAAAGNGK